MFQSQQMKYFLLAFLLIGSSVFAQSPKKISLEDIYKKNIFRTNSVYGLRSMKDGKTYVSIESDPISLERFVAKNNYSDGKIAEKLFTEKELIYQDTQLPIGTDFSADESILMIEQEE